VHMLPPPPPFSYTLNHTWGVPEFTTIYFIFLIMFGAFFMLNLALAVIWSEYAKAGQGLKDKREAKVRVCVVCVCPVWGVCWGACRGCVSECQGVCVCVCV
jgi:hypothetical protein